MPDPNQRITLQDVKQHPWFLMKLPKELQVSLDACRLALCRLHSLCVLSRQSGVSAALVPTCGMSVRASLDRSSRGRSSRVHLCAGRQASGSSRALSCSICRQTMRSTPCWQQPRQWCHRLQQAQASAHTASVWRVIIEHHREHAQKTERCFSCGSTLDNRRRQIASSFACLLESSLSPEIFYFGWSGGADVEPTSVLGFLRICLHSFSSAEVVLC